MKTIAWSLLLVCVVAASAAADGVYLTESVGGDKMSGALADDLPSALHARVSIGVRHGAWAIEGYVASAGPGESTYGVEAPTLTTLGIDVKYLHPLARHLEVYLRGGPSEGYGAGVLDGYSGRGLGFGAGIQLTGKVPVIGFLFFPLFFTGIGPKVTVSLYADDGYDFYRLFRDGAPSIDGGVTHITVGFAVGTDF